MLHFKNIKGFTLVELLVIVALLGVIIFAMIFGLNPLDQIQKAKDAQRKNDLNQIANALTLYYNDHSCYPSSVPFGAAWSEDGFVYMQKVPQDPDCKSKGNNSCYLYQINIDDSCPQWSVLYANLYQKLLFKDVCPMFAACGYYQSKYNYCVMGGNLDCSYISSNPIEFPTPTPTPICSLDYRCTGGSNPDGSGIGSRCNIVPQGTGSYCSATCDGECSL